jgi:type IV pilus assembly protein PilP
MNRWLGLAIFLMTTGAHAAPTKDPLTDFFKNKTKIDKPFELRDPFKQPVSKAEEKKSEKSGYYVNEKGLYSNISEQTIKNVQDIKVLGVLIGRERRVMVAGPKQGSIIVLKEGSKIGEEGAELKAILPGGIILVEKIVNVYGQEEYLETVIPISK